MMDDGPVRLLRKATVETQNNRAVYSWPMVVALLFMLPIAAIAVHFKQRWSNLHYTQQQGEVCETSLLGRLAWVFFLLFGGSIKSVIADGDFCLDCVNEGIGIPDQTYYTANLFTPPVIDLRRDSCGNCPDLETMHTTIHLTQGYHDFGIRSEIGDPLVAKIFGYTCVDDKEKGENSHCINPVTKQAATVSDYLNQPTTPGPTILVSKGCPVKITFKNKLGVDEPHLFAIDRTVHCGDAPNCTSQRGSDLRTTVQ
jgi:hypothetical protein